MFVSVTIANWCFIYKIVIVRKTTQKPTNINYIKNVKYLMICDDAIF